MAMAYLCHGKVFHNNLVNLQNARRSRSFSRPSNCLPAFNCVPKRCVLQSAHIIASLKLFSFGTTLSRGSGLPHRFRSLFFLCAIILLVTSGNGCSQKPSSVTPSGTIRGTVQLGPNVPLWMMHGTLTVVVYMKGSTSPAYLPVALEEFFHPTFPVPFLITQKNVRLSGIDLKGTVRLVAKLTMDSGSPLVASGIYTGTTDGEVAVGGPPVNLIIDTPSSR